MSRIFLMFSLLCSVQTAFTLDQKLEEDIRNLVLMDMQGLPFEQNSHYKEEATSVSDQVVGFASKKTTLKPLSAPKQSGPKLRMIQRMPTKD